MRALDDAKKVPSRQEIWELDRHGQPRVAAWRPSVKYEPLPDEALIRARALLALRVEAEGALWERWTSMSCFRVRNGGGTPLSDGTPLFLLTLGVAGALMAVPPWVGGLVLSDFRDSNALNLVGAVATIAIVWWATSC